MPFLLALVPLALPVQGAGFERTDYPGGGDARWVELGDIDGDGHLDVATALAGENAVGVRLGAGDGSLGGQQTTAAGSAPSSLALGDVDGDGQLDAVVVHSSPARLWFLEGTGSALFSPAPGESSGKGAVSVELADLDLDGDLDAVVGNSLSADVRVLLGDGTGAFPVSSAFAAGAPVSHVALADTDVDGDVDIAASRGFPFFSPLVLVNQGTGAFTEGPGSSLGGAPRWIALGDLTSDGLPDIAAPADDGIDQLVEVARNNGGNSFSTFGLVSASLMNELGDFNGDDLLDHLTLDSDGVVRVRFGDGVGMQASGGVPTDAPTAVLLAPGDVDGDGALDFVTANGGNAGISVLLNRSCNPPIVDSASPSSVPNATLGAPTEVLLTGCGLSSVTGVEVDGVPLLPFQFTKLSDALLSFDMPLVSKTGPVEVALFAEPEGTTFEIEVVPVEQPLVVLEGALPQFLQPTEPANALLVGTPGNVYFLFGSTVILPTLIPGVLELDIGLGFTSLVILSASVLGPSGWEQRSFPLGGLAPGAVFYLQGATLESLTASPPLTTTNLESGGIQP